MTGLLLAQTVWHKTEPTLSLPIDDSIPAVEDYSVITVLRSIDPDTQQLLWGITEHDTLRKGVLTGGIFTPETGLCSFSNRRDFSHWSIYYYHTGCAMDTTDRYALHLGPAIAHYLTDSVCRDTLLSARITMDEFVWFPRSLSRQESGAFITYLALKHGITLDEEASYVTPTGDTLWHSLYDNDYYHRVVGIGVDSLHGWFFGLSRTKEQAEMLLGCDSLRQGEYILIGDNDGEQSWTMQPDGRYRLERRWRLRLMGKTPVPVVLMWRPADALSDSTWLVITNADEQQIARLQPAGIVGDSLWQFPVILTDTLLTLQVETEGVAASRRNKAPRAGSNTSSDYELIAHYDQQGQISVEGLAADIAYDYYLYDSAGKLIRTLTDVVGSSALVGTLPTGVYLIEIIQHGHIIGDIRVIVK